MTDPPNITPKKEFIEFINNKRKKDPKYTVKKCIYTEMIGYLLINHKKVSTHVKYFCTKDWGDKALIYMYHYCNTYGSIDDEMCLKIQRGKMNELNPSYELVASTYLGL